MAYGTRVLGSQSGRRSPRTGKPSTWRRATGGVRQAGEGGVMPVVLKRWSVPTGEPCNTETVPHGSVGGRGKRSVSYLARGLPNLLRRSGFRQQVSPSVRLPNHHTMDDVCCIETLMNHAEFLHLVEKTDQTLAQQNVPVYARLFAAFRAMAGDYDGPIGGYGINPSDFPEYVGPNLIEKINDWYRDRYGEKFDLPSVLGRIPFLVRGQVFTAQIPLAYGQPRVNLLTLIDEMTESMQRSLTREELQYYTERWAIGYELVYEMEDMLGSGDLRRYTPAAAELIRKAIEDRDNAVDCLQGPHPRTNISCFHSQQHAEKMLKAVLIEKAGVTSTNMKKIGHKINDLVTQCLRVTSAFMNVQTDAALLANIPMDIRYEVAAVNSSVAVETYFAALRVGGFCATQISGHQRRLGTTKLTTSD
jgi:HEPN domain-containing protein